MNTRYIKALFFLLFNLFFSIIGCGQAANSTNKRTEPKSVDVDLGVQVQINFDSLQLHSFLEEYPNLKRYEVELWNFYRKRNFTYVWFDKVGLIEQAGNLTSRILSLEDEGVFKKLSYTKELDSLVHLSNNGFNQTKPNIKLELLLTGEYFVFAGLAWQGMNPVVSTYNSWMLPRKKITYELYLDSLLRAPAQKTPVKEPVYRQYELLKSYLRKYRSLDDRLNWYPIKANSKVSKTKDTTLINEVKKRLFQLEDYDGNLSGTLYNNDFRQALFRFQERHGLNSTGIINGETIAALNVPLKTRITQILVNMERSRWLPVSSEGDYLAVNIPEFKMHVYHNDNLLWSCKAVVGQTVHPTTLFYGEINQVVFSPYWNVPESIVINEILPGIRKSKNYLSNHQMEITGYRNGLPIIRQKPGASNSLGRVKFLFPNSYNIYLHDTPSKSLFEESERAFSHGCIRIAEPAKLAAFLLKEDEKWNVHNIGSAMHLGKEKSVYIAKKTPVFIAYFTAFIDRDGKLNFRKDIYQLDERLASTIISGNGAY